MRLAYFSPLNPVQSGIADYSEELLPYLARGAQIDLFVDGYRPANSAIVARFPVFPARGFPAAARRHPYDLAVYQMGNSPAHAYIYDRLLATPGVLVLHEFVLHHLRMWMALRRGRARTYSRMMETAYGAAGRQAAERVLVGQHPEALFQFPLVEEALAHARGVVVHSRYLAEQVHALRPDVPLAHVNMGVPLPPYVPPAAARARLGLPADVFILASLGHLNPYKRLNVALRAFKAFAMQEPRSLFLLVGSRSPNYDVDRMIAMLGLQERVRVIGFAPPVAFADYLAAADVCINLRYPTAGETSAALLRILGGGKPVLVSRVGAFAELPDAAAAKVDVGPVEEELVLEYLLLLARRPDLRRAMGRAARAYVAAEHTLPGAAYNYLRFFATLLGQAPPAPEQWHVSSEEWTVGREQWPDDRNGAVFAPGKAAQAGQGADQAAPDAAGDAGSVQPAIAASPVAATSPETPLEVLAEAAAQCGLAPDDPALPALLRRLDGLL